MTTEIVYVMGRSDHVFTAGASARLHVKRTRCRLLDVTQISRDKKLHISTCVVIACLSVD
jgi:hypothetical protein